MIGTDIAHYAVTSKLGQGGMGEVFRATDTKLDREVAVKVLPDSIGRDDGRLARFDREAKLLASLNHPNIAGIYGVEQEGDVHALVMELVDGEDLSQRLSRGPLPVDEALEIGRQIAEALEAAHGKGIIHRDLKPGNVMLTKNGMVKVLDFGLAKATEPGTSRSGAGTADSQAPTITANYTMPGTLLGTAAYMSPEQARGETVDKRSDIWSFGCVLVECLTGKPLFKGENVTETLASIIKCDPDWTALPEGTPPVIHLLLRRCLAKDRNRRLHDIADARIDLEDARSDPDGSFIRLGDHALQEKVPPGRQWALLSGGALFVAIASLAAGWLLKPTPEPLADRPELPVRFAITLPPDQEFVPERKGWTSSNMAMSPDGSEIVYVAVTHGQQNLYRRKFDSLEISQVANTDGARYPVYSPSGDDVAFFSEGLLKAVTLDTGVPRVIGQASTVSYGGCWTPDGFIYFTMTGSGGDLIEMSVSTGESRIIAGDNPDTGQIGCFLPEVLIPGESLLYSSMREGWGHNEARIAILDLKSGEQTEIPGLTGTDPMYLPSGHLVFARDEQLLAIPFDPHLRVVTGEQFLVEPDVGSVHGGEFSFSRSGDLAFQPAVGLDELVWVDEGGNSMPLAFPPGRYYDPEIDPTGRFVAVQVVEDDSNYTIVIGDLSTGSVRRVADTKAYDVLPMWSRDSRSIFLSSTREGAPDLYRVDLAEDADTPERILPPPLGLGPRWAVGWARDGRLAYFEKPGIWLVDAEDPTHVEPTAFKIDHFLEGKDYAIHPGGQWVAYATNQGRAEAYQVFIERFPEGGSKRMISVDGGYAPIWSPDGTRLYFQNGREMLCADIKPGDHLEGEGLPQVLFRGGYRSNASFTEYDIDPNSNRFLMVEPVSDPAEYKKIVIVRNALQALLTRNKPAGGQ